MMYCQNCKQKKNNAVTFWCTGKESKGNVTHDAVWICPECMMDIKLVLDAIRNRPSKNPLRDKFAHTFGGQVNFLGIPIIGGFDESKLKSHVKVARGYEKGQCSCCGEDMLNSIYVVMGRIMHNPTRIISSTNICQNCFWKRFDENKELMVAAIV